MKEISLYILCLLLISVVSGEEDRTCEAGEGRGYPDIRRYAYVLFFLTLSN